MLNSNLSAIKIVTTYKQYNVTLDANPYVSPFDAIGKITIPDNDIQEKGTPVHASASGSNGAPIPVNLIGKSVDIVGTTNYANSTVVVTFAKIVIDN